MAERVKIGKHKKIDKEVHDLLSEYYDVDDVENLCTITFNFSTFDECFETEDAKIPTLRSDLTEKVENVAYTVPKVYDLVIMIRIDDYQGYDKDQANDYFKKGIKMTVNKHVGLVKNKRSLSIIFAAIGISALLIMILLDNLFFDPDSIAGSITSEILDVTAWVFIWEAVTLYFLDRVENNFRWMKIMKRIKKVSFQ